MPTTLYTEAEIKTIVKQVAEQIKEHKHEQPPVLVCVLNGAFIFFADLVREIGDCEIDFIRVKSYEGITQGDLKITKSIEIEDIEISNIRETLKGLDQSLVEKFLTTSQIYFDSHRSGSEI